MTIKSNIIVSAGLGLVVLAAGLTLARSSSGNVETNEPGTRSKVASKTWLPYGAQTHGCSFAPGARMAYEVETTTDVEVDFSPLTDDLQRAGIDSNNPPTSVETQRNWRIELEAVATNERTSVLAATIEDHGAVVKRGTASPRSEQLDETFLIRVASDCSILEFGWRNEGALDTSYEQQLLTVALGFSVSENGDNSWVASNFDATGRYDVSYSRDSSGTIVGTILSGLLHQAGNQALVPMEVFPLNSRVEVQPAQGAWFETLSSQRSLELVMTDTTIGHHSRATSAKSVAPGRWHAAVDISDERWEWGHLLGRGTPGSTKALNPDLIDMPGDQALATYREIIAAKAGFAIYADFLADWLRANPEGADALLAELRAGSFEGTERTGVFYALGVAQTPQASAALVTLVQGDRPADLISAAQAMSLLDTPTLEMVELLEQRATDDELSIFDSGAVALALGAVAGTATSHPEIQTAAGDILDGWLQDTTDEQKLQTSLRAAGNAGLEELSDSIATHLGHEDPSVRETAISAMHKLPPERVLPHIEDTLLDDNANVRASALETAATIARRHPNALSDELVELAADNLGSVAANEDRAVIRLLGVAAGSGNTRASELLDTHIREQLDAEQRDYRRLAQIGASTPRQWHADD